MIAEKLLSVLIREWEMLQHLLFERCHYEFLLQNQYQFLIGILHGWFQYIDEDSYENRHYYQ